MNRVKLMLAVLLLGAVVHGQETCAGQKTGEPAANVEQKRTVLPLPESPKPQTVPDPKMLALLFAAAGGAGIEPSGGITGHGGIKLGFASVTLDLGYDRAAGHPGFITEGSVMLPVVRFPFRSKTESDNFLRIYAEPGIGNFSGKGPVGQYASAKVMMVFLSNRRVSGSSDGWSPFIEVQHRFPFYDPSRGDTRFSFGVMTAWCNSCE
jgi:hypothetical protein